MLVAQHKLEKIKLHTFDDTGWIGNSFKRFFSFCFKAFKNRLSPLHD